MAFFSDSNFGTPEYEGGHISGGGMEEEGEEGRRGERMKRGRMGKGKGI